MIASIGCGSELAHWMQRVLHEQPSRELVVSKCALNELSSRKSSSQSRAMDSPRAGSRVSRSNWSGHGSVGCLGGTGVAEKMGTAFLPACGGSIDLDSGNDLSMQ